MASLLYKRRITRANPCNPTKHSGPWFNMKRPSYQYWKSHCGYKTVVRSSYLHNGISYTGKMASSFWISPKILCSGCTFCLTLYHKPAIQLRGAGDHGLVGAIRSQSGQTTKSIRRKVMHLYCLHCHCKRTYNGEQMQTSHDWISVGKFWNDRDLNVCVPDCFDKIQICLVYNFPITKSWKKITCSQYHAHGCLGDIGAWGYLRTCCPAARDIQLDSWFL